MSEVKTDLTNRSAVKTVLEIDLMSYSDIARVLEENLNVEAVKSFQDQIQEFVDYGLAIVGLNRDDIVLATAGDNAILMFDNAVTMHNFAQAVHEKTSRHNASKSIPLARRWFRMGAATGVVMLVPAEHRTVGVTIARAVRLEAAAKRGQLVIDSETYQVLPAEIQDAYGPEEIIHGKRAERFRGHRCMLTFGEQHVPPAVPGGICISRVVRDQVRDKLDYGVEDLGEQQVKNITRPVRAFRVRHDATPLAAPPDPSGPLPIPDKPSIAVLPFTNMSSDPEQEFLADGIAEDMITALSRYPSLFVIARNSSFTYAGRAVDVKQVGRELGVRYVLEGSLRKSSNRIRVTAQLVEAETGTHVWAERYDRDLVDIFALQDEITEAVTVAIAPAIGDAEQQRAMRKSPTSLDAWAAYQRGLWHLKNVSAEDNAVAQKFFKQAVDLDPGFAGGYKGLSAIQSNLADYIGGDLSETLHSAEILARRAIALDGSDAEAHSLLSTALRRRGDIEGGLTEAARALALSPNLAAAHSAMGSSLISLGRLSEGIAAFEKSIRLDPRRAAVRFNQIALALYYSGRYEAAIETANRAIRSYPNYPNPYRWVAAALGQLGRIQEAKQSLQKAIAIAPAAFEMHVREREPWRSQEQHAHMLEGLRKAGWQDE